MQTPYDPEDQPLHRYAHHVVFVRKTTNKVAYRSSEKTFEECIDAIDKLKYGFCSIDVMLWEYMLRHYDIEPRIFKHKI